MKNIAILGAKGFVGRSLVEHLHDRYFIYPITRDQINLLDENSVTRFFEEFSIDVIINCANQGGSRKTAYQEVSNVVSNNLRLFFNLEKCLTSKMKMINFGSGAQYDKCRDLVKVEETSIGKNIPKDEYGFSKFVMSKYINKCPNIYNPIIFGLFGANEDYSFKFISNSILKNILKMPIEINQNVVFDYLYIKDFLKIIELIIENDYEYREFNITPDESIDLITIAEIINQYGKYKSEIIVKNQGFNYQYTGDNRRLHQNFSQYKFTSYEESIEELYQYYFDNISNLNTEIIRLDEYSKNCKTKF